MCFLTATMHCQPSWSPEWRVEGGVQKYGAAGALAICRYDQQPPVTALRLRGNVAEQHRVAQELQRDGIQLAPGALMYSARRVLAGDVTRAAAYHRGDV